MKIYYMFFVILGNLTGRRRDSMVAVGNLSKEDCKGVEFNAGGYELKIERLIFNQGQDACTS